MAPVKFTGQLAEGTKTETQAKRTGSPAAEQTNEERIGRRRRYWQSIRHVISVLITVAAAAVLVSTLLFPVFRIYGTSMTPALQAGDVVVAVRPTGSLKRGDLIAFYFNNKILIKRVIAKSGDWVDIDSDGNVYVNDKELSEPYLAANEKSLGTCTIDLLTGLSRLIRGTPTSAVSQRSRSRGSSFSESGRSPESERPGRRGGRLDRPQSG